MHCNSLNCAAGFTVGSSRTVQIYSVSQKKSPLRYSDIFFQRLGNFRPNLKFYTLITRFSLDYKFLSNYLQL